MAAKRGAQAAAAGGVVDQAYELVSVDRLTPHPDNPRRGDVGVIQESVGANGFYGALIVQRSTGHILAGNHRWQAAQAQGITSLPVLWVDVDDERARRILLADNRANDVAGYDEEALLSLLNEVSASGGLLGTGYSDDDLVAMLDAVGSTDTADALAGTKDRYVEQYGVIVVCSDETHQRKVYDELKAAGFSCRVVTT